MKGSSPSPGSLSPNHQPVVNFRDIGDLAKSSSASSSNQPVFNPDQGMVLVAVHPATLAAAAAGHGQAPIILGMSDLVSNEALSCVTV